MSAITFLSSAICSLLIRSSLQLPLATTLILTSRILLLSAFLMKILIHLYLEDATHQKIKKVRKENKFAALLSFLTHCQNGQQGNVPA